MMPLRVLPRLLAFAGIAAVLLYIGLTNVHPPPRAPAVRVDDDPDPLVRAEQQCAAVKSTPNYLHAAVGSDFRRMQDEWCEEQRQEAVRIRDHPGH